MFGALLILTTITASAAGSPPLSWEEVRQTALTQNASLGSSRKTTQASVALKKEALWGGTLPKLILNGSRSRTANDVSPIVTKQTDYVYGGTASLNLFRGFGTYASVARASAAVGAAESDERLTSANLRHELRVAFFNVYIQQERQHLNEKDFKRSDLNYRLEQLKYGSGSEALWSVRTAKAELDRARYTLEAGKIQLATARETLAQLLEVDTLPDREVANPDPSTLSARSDNPVSAIEHHPELDKYRYLDQEAFHDIRIARAAYWPTLDASFSRTWNDQRLDGTPAQKYTVNTFALTASWSIFNGAYDYFAVSAASYTHEAAELTTASTERRLVNSLRLKNAAYRTAIDLLPVDRAAREAAEERERVVTQQYRAGVKAYIDWEQAETQLLTTEQEEIKALSEALTAYADLELALGTTLEQP